MSNMRLITGDGCSISVLEKYLYMAKHNADTYLPSIMQYRRKFHITEFLQQYGDQKAIGFIDWNPNILESLVDILEEFNYDR